jgi:uncharacterized protein with PIN domain
MKFIADVMLGRLAKRLRLLGFDVLYDRSLDDNEIIRLSLEQDRIILSRDTRLTARPLASNHLLIESDRLSDQFRQIFDTLKIEAPLGFLTRCSLCNQPLAAAQKQDVKDLVPEHVYATKDAFFVCAGCGKVYWKGSHVRRMERNRKQAGG